MPTQSLSFGYTTGQTLTAKLFAIAGDSVIATAGSVGELTNAKNRYLAQFEDVPAGDYLLVYYLGGNGVGSERYSLTFATATFEPWSEAKPLAITGTGDYALAITATEDGDAVRGVKITLAGSTRSAFTDDDGAAALNLTAGSHVLIVTPPGDYAPFASISLTIDPEDASPISIPIALTRVSVTPPTAGNVCRVTLRVADESDAPWVAMPVFATLVSGPAISSTLHANRGEPVLTDADGIATLDRLQGQVYDITAQRPDGVEITIRRQLPNAANADLSTLTVPS